MTPVDELRHRLRRLTRPLLVGLDVDGTLAPIVKDPDAARIPASTMDTLEGLSTAPDIELALLTGRDLPSLRRMEQLRNVWRAVEHGGVVLAPGESIGKRVLPEDKRDALARFRAWVEERAQGAFIEYKPEAIAVHVRSIGATDPERAQRLMDEADALGERLGLHVRRGKALREAEVAVNDKGQALLEIFERSGAASVFFAGDDLTDFSAIELATEHGVGVFVRSSERSTTPVRGAIVLDGIDELATALAGLLQKAPR